MSIEKVPKSRWTLLSALVCFVFVILVVASILGGICGYLLYVIGLLERFPNRLFPIWLVILLAPSIIIGTILTAAIGKRPLRPFRAMMEATQKIAAGNFEVRLPVRGPREVRLLNKSFNAMAEGLASIETLRSDFVSNISHEFKTPIVSIKGFAKLLKKDDLSPEQRQEYLDIIIMESERLSRLSSNVLLLSKLETQQSVGEAEQFYLDEQLRQVILLLEPQCRQKQLELHIDLEPATIRTNEELLHHVWLNLLSNAVKFTAPGGRIDIGLRADGERLTVSITDSGVGMEPEVRARLFDKFYQGESSRATEGNGLGLSLARRIIELADGAIQVESEVGKGSRFAVTLPAGVPPQTPLLIPGSTALTRG